jgi:hypothetical protein
MTVREQIEKNIRRGDYGIVAKRLKMKPRKVWAMIRENAPLDLVVADAFIKLFKERKEEEKRMLRQLAEIEQL